MVLFTLSFSPCWSLDRECLFSFWQFRRSHWVDRIPTYCFALDSLVLEVEKLQTLNYVEQVDQKVQELQMENLILKGSSMGR